jgi:cytochrome c oxidase assembly factor CtaG
MKVRDNDQSAYNPESGLAQPKDGIRPTSMSSINNSVHNGGTPTAWHSTLISTQLSQSDIVHIVMGPHSLSDSF